MQSGKDDGHPLRKHIRAELAAASPPKKISLGGIAIVIVLGLLLLPALAILVYLWFSGGFTELGAFTSWLFDCMGADCP